MYSMPRTPLLWRWMPFSRQVPTIPARWSQESKTRRNGQKTKYKSGPPLFKAIKGQKAILKTDSDIPVSRKQFCHYCGGPLTRKHWEGRSRLFCPCCHEAIYENPVPATAVVVPG